DICPWSPAGCARFSCKRRLRQSTCPRSFSTRRPAGLSALRRRSLRWLWRIRPCRAFRQTPWRTIPAPTAATFPERRRHQSRLPQRGAPKQRWTVQPWGELREINEKVTGLFFIPLFLECLDCLLGFLLSAFRLDTGDCFLGPRFFGGHHRIALRQQRAVPEHDEKPGSGSQHREQDCSQNRAQRFPAAIG